MLLHLSGLLGLYFLIASVASRESDVCCTAPVLTTSQLNTVYNLNFYRSKSTALQIFSDMTIPCNGSVVMWNFVSRISQVNGLHLSVWRLASSDGIVKKYRLIGQTVVNNFTAITNAWNSYSLFEPFEVVQGDVIGIFYDNWVTADRFAAIPDAGEDTLLPYEENLDLRFFETHVALSSAISILTTSASDLGMVTIDTPSAGRRLPGLEVAISKIDRDQLLTGSSQFSELACKWPPFDYYATENLKLYRGRSTALQVLHGMPLACSGSIVAWNFLAVKPNVNALHLSVWRQIVAVDTAVASTASPSRVFRLLDEVHINNVTVKPNSWNTFSQFNPIPVQAGDVIGFFYDTWANPYTDVVIPHADRLEMLPPEAANMTFHTSYVSLINAEEIYNSEGLVSFHSASFAERTQGIQAVVSTALTQGVDMSAAAIARWQSIGCN